MPKPTEHKTVQARLLAYAQEIGWTYVPRADAEARSGFDPEGATQEERARSASLFFGDLLYARVCAFNPQYREAEGALVGEFQRLRADRERFKARVLAWAAKLDVKASVVYVRPMRRKWASCSTAGTLSFNDELLGMDAALGDYVIVHELLHFSVPNHGKLWRSLMRVHLGDYEVIEKELKKTVMGRNER